MIQMLISKRFRPIRIAAVISLTLFGLIPRMGFAADPPHKILNVGIVQRFGSNPTDKLILKAKPGDHLTLRFLTPEGKKILHTASVKLEVGMASLPQPALDERLILSTHRSFESAEESASQWQKLGLVVEIAQPNNWQVWAKRDVYNTPLLRRLLLQSIEAHGEKTAFLETQVRKQMPQVFWVLNKYRYNRKELEISSGQNVIEVSRKENDPESRVYSGTLKLQPNAYSTYTLVNQVPLETYLRGVVPHEIGAWPPMAALEAQAILARTYALRNLRRFQADHYELCADTHCQVYRGLTEVYPSTDQAVANTRNQVIAYENELADALYSAACGGITADFNDVWNGEDRPYLKPVIDSPIRLWNLSTHNLANENNLRRFMNLKKGFNEEDIDEFRWREESSIAALTQDLKQYLQEQRHPLAQLKTIQKIEVVERSPSGRVLKTQVKTDLGTLVLTKDEVQDAFYPPLSTFFYLEPLYNPDKTLKGYAFIGGGFGHGVGMSQTGAQKLAKLGWTSDRILSFYFPGTQVQPLDESITLWQTPQ